MTDSDRTEIRVWPTGEWRYYDEKSDASHLSDDWSTVAVPDALDEEEIYELVTVCNDVFGHASTLSKLNARECRALLSLYNQTI
jgi:hypothetical protein